MALLVCPDRSPLPVPPRLLVGRASTATLQLDEPHVSGEHATVWWSPDGWRVRDLASRNGTFVNGCRVARGQERPLVEGDQLGFGAPEPVFCLTDASPPGAVAVATDGTMRTGETLVALPDEQSPDAVVFADEVGGWWLEIADRRTRVTDGHTLVLRDQTWRVHLPERLAATGQVQTVVPLSQVALAFAVSRDEEHIGITVRAPHQIRQLQPREHAYVLLLLARQRLTDAALPEADQGWVDRDELLRWLQLDANALNVAIYRARGQLARAGIDGAAGIVEVRRRQRRLGIDAGRLVINESQPGPSTVFTGRTSDRR